jgi:hypothetical protein
VGAEFLFCAAFGLVRAIKNAHRLGARHVKQGCTGANLVFNNLRDCTHWAFFKAVAASNASVFLYCVSNAANNLKYLLRACINADAAANAFVIINYWMCHQDSSPYYVLMVAGLPDARPQRARPKTFKRKIPLLGMIMATFFKLLRKADAWRFAVAHFRVAECVTCAVNFASDTFGT